MTFVVAPRRPGCKPSIAASLPASLFGKFAPNGGGPASNAGGKPEVAHRKDEAVRSEPYLRLVALRPCKNCGRRGPSQAAHPPPKGKQIKQDDREAFPLCADGPRRKGCHPKFDNYDLMPHAAAVKQAKKWGAETRAEIEAEGKWPKKLAKWGGA